MAMRVLHVEDNPQDADLARRFLAKQAPDISLDCAATVADGWARLSGTAPYDLALLDLKLPDGSGLELLTRIRERQLPVAVVMLTGSGDQEAAIAALKAGADDYLTKGHLEQVSVVLRDALRRFREAKEERSRPLRVLYAEHHEADIDLAERHLARYAPQVRLTVVRDAAQALARLPQGPGTPPEFDVLLMDYRLPGQDALAVTKVLRQERGLDIPIVLVSGHGNEEVAAQALRLGVAAFVTKHEGYLYELFATLEKVQRQAELEHYRQHLEKLVETRTAELAAALRRAEHLAQVKSTFLANMSHEIRTPLNGVLGFAQIGYRESAGQDRMRAHFGRILDSGNLLLGVINDILDFSKIEAGQLNVTRIPTDLNQVVGHLLEIFKDRVAAKGLKLLLKKAGDPPDLIVSDPLRLGQILLNLLSNAVKFTEQGHIELGVARQDDCLNIWVADTGIGMNEAQLACIFEPFKQATVDTARKFGGTGLGLSISRRLVELMGGEITATSTPGQGSTFKVCLPLEETTAQGEAAPLSAVPAEPAALRLSGLSVLAAEDNEINQIVLTDMLESEGARVVMTNNGREAVERFAGDGRAAYDLVLLDISMPIMDGHEAARRILALAPDMPIVGQTAYAMAEEKAACLAAGMVDHIAKPIDLEELVRILIRHGRGACG
jgi:signal transduction histidine kinase